MMELTDQNMKTKSQEESTTVLPTEVVMEILSWLPVKPLTRAQLVRREWRAMIQDRHFIEKHMNRASYACNWYNTVSVNDGSTGVSRPTLLYVHGCDGMVLLKNNTTEEHILWNPAAHLLLQLPPPIAGDLHLHGYALCFAPANKIYKIVSFFKDDHSGKHACQLLVPGTSMEWKLLEFPKLVNGDTASELTTSVVLAGGVPHFVVVTKVGEEAVAEVVSFDAEAEVLTLNVFNDVGAAKAIDCDGKLGFAVVDKQGLHVRVVLDDFKKKRWCRNQEVIPLPFLKGEGFEGENVVVLFIEEGRVWFWLEDEKIFVYKIKTGKTRDVRKCKGLSLRNKLYTYKPSLVSVEGMEADDEYRFSVLVSSGRIN